MTDIRDPGEELYRETLRTIEWLTSRNLPPGTAEYGLLQNLRSTAKVYEARHSGVAQADFTAYSMGVCYASICTSLPIGEAEDRMNTAYPTGIASRWKLSEDNAFRTGAPNPCPCPDLPETHRHYLLSC